MLHQFLSYVGRVQKGLISGMKVEQVFIESYCKFVSLVYLQHARLCRKYRHALQYYMFIHIRI